MNEHQVVVDEEMQPALFKAKKVIRPGRGRKPSLTVEQVRYCRDNPDQLSYDELGMKFAVGIATIRNAIRARGNYGRGKYA